MVAYLTSDSWPTQFGIHNLAFTVHITFCQAMLLSRCRPVDYVTTFLCVCTDVFQYGVRRGSDCPAAQSLPGTYALLVMQPLLFITNNECEGHKSVRYNDHLQIMEFSSISQVTIYFHESLVVAALICMLCCRFRKVMG